MTPSCVEELVSLEKPAFGDNDFAELSVEQLLLAAIAGTDIDDVWYILEYTDWVNWLNIKKHMENDNG